MMSMSPFLSLPTESNMKIKLTERTRITVSPIRAIFQQIPEINVERTAAGLDPIIDLSIGQPHISVNPAVLTGLRYRLEEPGIERSFGYSQVQGRIETLQAIIALYKDYYPGITYSTKEVMCTNGANQALWNALSILIQERKGKKDIVLSFEPYFGQYNAQVATLGGELVSIPTSHNRFRPSAEELKLTLKEYPHTKVLIINYPNNPSGVSLTKDEAIEILKVLAEYPKVALILDEVYREISYQPFISLLNIEPIIKERSIVINSCSKGLISAPDMRIGIVAAPARWITAMSYQQLLTTASVSYLSQIAFTSAVRAKVCKSSLEWEQENLAEYSAVIEKMTRELSRIGLPPVQKPDGSFYILINANSLIGKKVPPKINITNKDGSIVTFRNFQKKIGTRILTSDLDIACFFLHGAGVAMVPGSGFGIDPEKGFLRISSAIKANKIDPIIRQLNQACESLL